MKKLIITVGISNSGKSTYASSLFNTNPDLYRRVNRDKIRELLFGYSEENVWTYYERPDIHKLEKQVTEYEDALIKDSLSRNKTVIVDATHLDKKYIDRFKFYNVDTEVVYFDIDFELACLRDSNRTRSVGREVIRKQLSKYKNLNYYCKEGWKAEKLALDETLPPCIIFDIDGTIAHRVNRSPYDWAKVGEDVVDKPVKVIYDLIAYNYQYAVPIICTGRDGICEEATKLWLKGKGFISPVEFHIRDVGNTQPDWVIKRKMWEDIAKRYNILCLVDDRCQVVDYARSLGLKVLQVDYGNF